MQYNSSGQDCNKQSGRVAIIYCHHRENEFDIKGHQEQSAPINTLVENLMKSSIVQIILFVSALFLNSTLVTSTNAIELEQRHVNKALINYTDMGQGQPLVLIHAFPTDLRLWQPQYELKKHFRVITLDLFGFGGSEDTDGNAVTMSIYADEVKELLNRLHIEKAIIGGESMGGYVALAFLQKYPEHVDGLILSGTQAIADNDEVKLKRESVAQDVLNNGTAGLIEGFLPKALSASASPETKAFLLNILKSQRANGAASAVRGMALRVDTSGYLSRTDVPILIISDEKDSIVAPQESKNMHALAKNSKWVNIEGAGHLVNLEKPEEWNRAVIGMFAGK